MSVDQQMTAREFRDEGYLAEANRQFFHPLGLALALKWDGVGDHPVELTVLDGRDDPDGWIFGEPLDDVEEKADRIAELVADRKLARVERLGYWIQPVR